MRHIYKIVTGATEWVSAESPEEALRHLADFYGSEEWAELTQLGAPRIERLPGWHQLSVREDGSRDVIAKTCGEWAAEMAGVVASSEI